MAKSQRIHTVIFQPSGRRGSIIEGKTVLEAARELGVDLESVCGGHQKCGKCLVRIEEGYFETERIQSGRDHLSPVKEKEREVLSAHSVNGQAEGYRLACAARIKGDVLVFVPEESRQGRQVVRKEFTARAVTLNPAVKRYHIGLSPPLLHNAGADWDRLKSETEGRSGLSGLTVDYPVLVGLQKILRLGDWKATASVWMAKEVVGLEAGFIGRSYGMAVDIGTTTLAGYLCDLTSGQVAATNFMMNPQIPYGEDVISRISYAVAHKDGLKKMQRAVIAAINSIARQLALQVGIKRQDIVDMAVVGNTCMHHLFLGINPEYLGRAPFSPALNHSVDIKARDLGIRIAPGAYVHVLPNEAGFVGADNVAVLIAEEPYNQDEMWLIVDIGTNTELVLGNRAKLVACSCATGPAFEGAHIKFGMRAAEGAIERVEIDPMSKEVRFKVIGKDEWNSELDNAGARGICGSGIIDAVAEMYRSGILLANGRFNQDLKTPRLRLADGIPEFVIAWAEETAIARDITISQADVRTVQLAKGALYAGIKLAFRYMNVETVDRVILAGGFGTYINPRSALTMGLLPPVAPDRIRSVGNAAGYGACLTLFNRDKRAEADRVARQVQYIELATEQDFQKEFIQALKFPLDANQH